MKQLFFLLILITFQPDLYAQPLDDIVPRQLIKDRKTLAYQPLREADIMWEKRIWRVIDVREKMNLPFMYPEAPFFKILENAAMEGQINLYSTEDDRFLRVMDEKEMRSTFYKTDTVEVTDPVDFSTKIKIVESELNFENVKRFRIKEVWYFDENTGTMKVRILGIAPLIEAYDDNDNFKFERPLFWVYYPECRELLAKQQVFNSFNDRALTTWDDLFEMRLFSSYIYKTSNVRNDRIRDYASGVDMLLEADKIKNELFNFEHDLWTY
jgi:gliding motility associated protien GldN